MKHLLLCLLPFILLNACKTRYRKAADEIASKMQAPTDMNVGKQAYSLAIPKGWTTERRSVYGIDYYFLEAPQTTSDPNTNINVITESTHHLSLETFETKTIASVKGAIPSAFDFNEGRITANGLSGVWFSYSMDVQGIEASLVCYIFPKDTVAYIITAGTQTKDASRYRALFDSTARSFKLDWSHEE